LRAEYNWILYQQNEQSHVFDRKPLTHPPSIFASVKKVVMGENKIFSLLLRRFALDVVFILYTAIFSEQEEGTIYNKTWQHQTPAKAYGPPR
jgi:hypothetical protein